MANIRRSWAIAKAATGSESLIANQDDQPLSMRATNTDSSKRSAFLAWTPD
jgi:hypothetical protein